jgi:hypothetical protein
MLKGLALMDSVQRIFTCRWAWLHSASHPRRLGPVATGWLLSIRRAALQRTLKRDFGYIAGFIGYRNRSPVGRPRW